MARVPQYPIDFVLPWVDGGDPAWIRRMRENLVSYRGADVDVEDRRYRDFGLLKYWFRSVESCAPWVRNVFFITDGQFPDWLNPEAEKLVWVRHEDFIPREWLPVFSPRPIELNLHRIEGLSEHFVYFNDDMYLLRPVKPRRYFRGGRPVANARISFTVPRVDDPYAHVTLNNVMAINRNFDKRTVVSKNLANWYAPWRVGVKEAALNLALLPFGWFPGFASPHMPAPFLKSTFYEVWAKEHDALLATSQAKFRTYADVTQGLLYEWQIASGVAVSAPRSSLGHYCACTLDNYQEIADDIRSRRYPAICVNDAISDLDDEQYAAVCGALGGALEELFPNKSSFEL